MSRLSKGIIVGLVTAALGIALAPLLPDLEEGVGLEILFKMRGPRPAPQEVVVVALDRLSAEGLNLPPQPEKWPRSLHARLTDDLARGQASVIAFDIIFDKAGESGDDGLFAEAIARAGNVVLCEFLRKETISVGGKGDSDGASLSVEKLDPPISVLADRARGLGPFPLPKVPVRVSQYWAFKTGAGDIPTLPVVAFQTYALRVYDEFLGLLKEVQPSASERLPRHRGEALVAGSMEKLAAELRAMFEENPHLADQMQRHLEDRTASLAEGGKDRLLRSIIRLYGGANSRFLNFYGPPGSIRTVSFRAAMDGSRGTRDAREGSDWEGKAVFVGLSEQLRPEQKDGFHTVFSQPNGVDISGVEIAATAFANLLEDMPVRPLSTSAQLATLFIWGLGLGMGCRVLSPMAAAGCVPVSGLLYFVLAESQFRSAGNWYPLVIPLFIQAPIAFFGSLVWRYHEASRERENIRRAFGFYLPDDVVNQLSRGMVDMEARGQVVQGICLSTDAEKYTSLSETMDPRDLSRLMNSYYEAVFAPVRTRGGIVSNVVGDAMLALWATAKPDISLRRQACLAALEILQAVDQFNRSSKTVLPTRLGVHSGEILLGNVGALDHYEYRPMGDIVNTATRIEGLNKILGTRLLVSATVVGELDGLLTRELGAFILAGKSRPIVVHELVARKEDADEAQRSLCGHFTDALTAYRMQRWEEAMARFRELMKAHEDDGPSRFYLRLCEKHRQDPPRGDWDGVVTIRRK